MEHAQSDASQLDYFLNETDRWIVLPYELSGLSSEELREHKPELRNCWLTFSRALASIAQRLRPFFERYPHYLAICNTVDRFFLSHTRVIKNVYKWEEENVRHYYSRRIFGGWHGS